MSLHTESYHEKTNMINLSDIDNNISLEMRYGVKFLTLSYYLFADYAFTNVKLS